MRLEGCQVSWKQSIVAREGIIITYFLFLNEERLILGLRAILH